MRLHVAIASIFLAFLLTGLSSADNNSTTSPKPSEPTSEPTSSPTHKPTTQPTPETTAKPTAVPTTHSATTTGAPETTTFIPSSTTPKSGDEVGTWNITCIVAKMEVEFVFPNNSVIHTLSPKAKDDASKCNDDDDVQLLALEDGMFKLNLTFFNDTKETYVRNISIMYPTATAEKKAKTSGKFFAVSHTKSFKCDSQELVKIDDEISLRFSKLKVQGFLKEGQFDEEAECPADMTLSDIVPIAVALVLLAMVIIILISYLVFRRQSRQRGYQSV